MCKLCPYMHVWNTVGELQKVENIELLHVQGVRSCLCMGLNINASITHLIFPFSHKSCFFSSLF